VTHRRWLSSHPTFSRRALGVGGPSILEGPTKTPTEPSRGLACTRPRDAAQKRRWVHEVGARGGCTRWVGMPYSLQSSPYCRQSSPCKVVIRATPYRSSIISGGWGRGASHRIPREDLRTGTSIGPLPARVTVSDLDTWRTNRSHEETRGAKTRHERDRRHPHNGI
jgi:hypothetical protein